MDISRGFRKKDPTESHAGTLPRRPSDDAAPKQLGAFSLEKFTASVVPQLIIDPATGKIVQANKAATLYYGYTREKIVTLNYSDLSIHDGRYRVDGDPFVALTHQRANGETRPVHVLTTAVPYDGRVMLLVVVQDIKERRRGEKLLHEKESRIREFDKMAAVEVLSREVQKDLRELHEQLLEDSKVLHEHLRTDPKLQKLVARLRHTAEEAATISTRYAVRQRSRSPKVQLTSIARTIQQIAEPLRNLMTEEISLAFDFDEDIWKANVDPVEIENIVINLVLNARDAIHYSGSVKISTHNVEITSADLQNNSELVPGKYVELIVEDNGVGMERDTIDHMFDPFFSRKLNGDGLGLGLTTVMAFVRNFHGQIKVKSQINQGSRISVFFPARESDSGTAVPRNASSTIIRRMGRAGQTPVVLLTEHDDIVRNSVRMILKRGGYQVHAAASGREALEIARRHPGEIDLILTDATLPDMTGQNLARDIMSMIGPDRAILMSAYPDEALRGVLADSNPLPFIAKPFRPADLLQKLFEILQACQPGQ